MTRTTGWVVAFLAGAAALGCGNGDGAAPPEAPTKVLGGRFAIDGSANVYLLTDPVARAFRHGNPGVWVEVKASSSGEGFRRLAAGEVAACNACRPLTRHLFLYVNRSAAERPEVDAFVRYYLAQAGATAAQVGYVPLTPAGARAVRRRYEDRQAGSVFAGRPTPAGNLEAILEAGS